MVNFRIGKTPARNDLSQWREASIPWVSIGDLKDLQTIQTTKEKISAAAFRTYFRSRLVPKGTLLMSFKLTIGKVSILGIEAVHNEAIISIYPYLNINDVIKNYLFYIMGRLSRNSDKVGAIKGVTLNKETIAKLLIPLPPIEEQNRIVEKLCEIWAWIKRYGDVESKLTSLENGFEGRIKASVLRYAIEGKLVKQDPNDEPASVLLERIKAEKERLVREGKIKPDRREAALASADDKGCYRNHPQSHITFGWNPCRIKSLLLSFFGGGTPSKQNPSFWGGGIPWCTVKDLGKEMFVGSTAETLTKEGLKANRGKLVKRGQLILCTRMAVGKLRFAVVDMSINQDLKGVILSENINSKWFYYLVNAMDFNGSGTTVPGIKEEEFLNSRIILPPYNEQVRIAKKIDRIWILLR